MFLDIIHRLVFIYKHNVTETGFYVRLQVEPTQLGQSIELVHISGDPESGIQNVVCFRQKQNDG
jgi:hypothetical protein